MSQVTARLRQWLYPRPFRIPSPVWPDDVLFALKDVMRGSPVDAAALLPGGDQVDQDALLANIGTNLWRMRRKLINLDSGQPREELREAYRYFESMWDTLAQAGIDILDHTNNRYDPGLGLKVLAFQPTSGIGREIITDTLRPTIYRDKTMLQAGEVIVAVPPPAAEE